MKNLKILFSEPICPRKVTWGKFNKGSGNNTFSYGLANVAAYSKKCGYRNIKFVEPQIEKMTKSEYYEFLRENKFDVVGITSCSPTIDFAFETFRLVKKALPNALTVLGGVHATILPEDCLGSCDELDVVCVGEGELTFVEILKWFEKGNPNLSKIKGIAYRKGKKNIVNERREVIPDLNILPVPEYGIFPMKKYKVQITNAKVFPTYTMLASRGCPYRCIFCNSTDVHGKRTRYKSPEKVFEEMQFLRNNYDARGIAFMDSTLTANRDWVNEFCDLLIKNGSKIPWSCLSRTDTVDEKMLKKMKKAGCWGITYGIESGNQKSLNLLQKGTTVKGNTKTVLLSLKLGYFVYATYIICLPGEDEKDALKTINYAKGLTTHSALFYLPVPFPKTRLYEICEREGSIKKDVKWSDFNIWSFDNPVYINPKIGKGKMQKLYDYAYRFYFTSPRVILRNMMELKSKDAFFKYFYSSRCVLRI